MAVDNQDQSTWVVLINKSPKGPLTEFEIRSLIEQGVLRVNDVAFRVDNTQKGQAEWKFLWQFVEFDRRRNETPEDRAVREAKFAEERRKAAAAPPDVTHVLPEELLNISPEELIVRSKSHIDRQRPLETTAEEMPALPQRVESHGNGGRWFLMGASLVMMMGVVYFFSWVGKTTSQSTTASNRVESRPAPAPRAHYDNGPLSSVSRTARPNRNVTSHAPKARPPETLEPPPKPDRGEIQEPNEDELPSDDFTENEEGREEEVKGRSAFGGKDKKKRAPAREESDEPSEASEAPVETEPE